MKILFAHGFEGSCSGTKPRYLRDTLGHEVIAPTMYARGWTFEGHVDMVPIPSISTGISISSGSSMEGLPAVALSQRPDRSVRAVLLAPAVGIHEAWADDLGQAGMRDWAETGTRRYLHRGLDEYLDLPYDFWCQCRDAAGVGVTHPCIIVHGIDDTVVPIERSEALQARSTGVIDLVRVDDGHRLHKALPQMESVLARLMA